MLQTHLVGVCFGLALTACSPDKGETSSTGGSTGTSGGGSSGEATGAATESTTNSATSVGDVTGGGSATSAAASSGPATSSGPTTSGPETTGGGEAGECAGPADCKPFSDCCVCDAVPLADMTPACPMECEQTKCSEYGVDAVECRLGVCRPKRLSCDGNSVACDALPPPCPDGFLAETSLACWTGKCVPAALCDVVPDCALCPAGTVCVQDGSFGLPPWPRCEPVPAACNGTASCACMGEVCTGDFDQCTMYNGDQYLSCWCPDCGDP